MCLLGVSITPPYSPIIRPYTDSNPPTWDLPPFYPTTIPGLATLGGPVGGSRAAGGVRGSMGGSGTASVLCFLGVSHGFSWLSWFRGREGEGVGRAWG